MTDNSPASLSQSINWQFRLFQQGMASRYGTLGALYYKQYLPGGIEVIDIHPPRQISQKLYYVAQAEYNRQNKNV